MQIFEVSSAIALQLAWQSGDGQKGKGFHDLKDHLGKTTALSICISLHLNLHIYIYNHTYLQKFISAYVYICMYTYIYTSGSDEPGHMTLRHLFEEVVDQIVNDFSLGR